MSFWTTGATPISGGGGGIAADVLVEQAAVRRIIVVIKNPATHTPILVLEKVLIFPPVRNFACGRDAPGTSAADASFCFRGPPPPAWCRRREPQTPHLGFSFCGARFLRVRR